MVLNIILALSIPITLLVMGYFFVKLIDNILAYAIRVQEMEEQKKNPPINSEEGEEKAPFNELTNEILNEYLNGKEEM